MRAGVRSFVQYLHEKRDLTPLHPQVIYMKGEANGAVAEVALQYCEQLQRADSFLLPTTCTPRRAAPTRKA